MARGINIATHMPSTFTRLHYHIVFATKHRQPTIPPETAPQLHAYLGGCLRRVNCTPMEIGGVSDHVHILTAIPPTLKVSEIVGDIKSASSAWMHREQKQGAFWWQEGYAAMTADHFQVDELKRYIRNQEAHHAKRTFLEEYREMLSEMGYTMTDGYLP